MVVLGWSLLWNGCASSPTEPQGQDGLQEFINYAEWQTVDRLVGPDPFLANAHGVSDNFVRVIYSTAPQPASHYPPGTKFVKELRRLNGEPVGPLTAMIKRGADFNPAGNGWEWFMTNETRDAIMTRGDNATAAGGMCAGCHSAANSAANGLDWVFRHPKEARIDLADFVDFAGWAKVDENFGPDPLLQAAHGVPDSLSRVVYFNHVVRPIRSVYPTGTIIVKELRNQAGQNVGPLTVMAKRGGSFNPSGNGWEWLMTNEARNAIVSRGDNATALNGMCAACHSAAMTGANGTDWVFSHPR